MPDQPTAVSSATELGMVITLRDVYSEVRGLSSKLDGLNTIPAEVRDHETRLRKIEQRVWSASGAAAVVGAVIGALAPSVLH